MQRLAGLRAKAIWNEYYSSVKMLIDRYDLQVSFSDYNTYAWNVFNNLNDTKKLRNALNWSNKSIQLASRGFLPNYLDTKANIIYKLGRTQEAMALEEQAISLAQRTKLCY